MFTASFPAILRGISYRSARAAFALGDSYAAAAYLLAFFANTVLLSNHIQFMIAAIADFSRRRSWKRTLAELVRLWASSVPADWYQIRPRANDKQLIDLSVPHNVLLWLRCRLTLDRMGKRFRQRIEAYTSIYSVFIFAIAIDILLTAGFKGRVNALSFSVIAVLVLEFTVFTSVTIFFASQVNEQDHVDMLIIQEEIVRRDCGRVSSCLQMQLRRSRIAKSMQYPSNRDKAVQLDRAIAMLTSVAKYIKHYSDTKPVMCDGAPTKPSHSHRVMGFQASPNLNKTFLTAILSGIPVLLELLRRTSDTAVTSSSGGGGVLSEYFSIAPDPQCFAVIT